MEKFYGKVGFINTEVTSPGVYGEVAVEKPYYGEVERNSFRLSGNDKVNENVVIVNTITIVADAYATEHFSSIRYIEWLGSKWKVSSVQVERPVIRMTLGEVWNGVTADENS